MVGMYMFMLNMRQNPLSDYFVNPSTWCIVLIPGYLAQCSCLSPSSAVIFNQTDSCCCSCYILDIIFSQFCKKVACLVLLWFLVIALSFCVPNGAFYSADLLWNLYSWERDTVLHAVVSYCMVICCNCIIVVST